MPGLSRPTRRHGVNAGRATWHIEPRRPLGESYRPEHLLPPTARPAPPTAAPDCHRTPRVQYGTSTRDQQTPRCKSRARTRPPRSRPWQGRLPPLAHTDRPPTRMTQGRACGRGRATWPPDDDAQPQAAPASSPPTPATASSTHATTRRDEAAPQHAATTVSTAHYEHTGKPASTQANPSTAHAAAHASPAPHGT